MRRRALLLGAGAALGGCGFHPLYAPTSFGTPGPAAAELAAVYIPPITERTGQLIRQALQQRFEGTGTGTAKRYELLVTYGVAAEGQAIQRDSSSTRIRLVGTATFNLRELSLTHKPLTVGTARVLDGYNILNQQYFAASLENDAAQERIAQSLADQITLKLGIYFKQAAAPA